MGYIPKIRRKSGGDLLEVASGGVIDILAGGALKLEGSTILPIAGVASGYKIARGTVTPTNTSTTIATGLATVVAVVVSFKGNPSLTHMYNAASVGNQAGAPAAGSFVLTALKPTAANDATPIAATTPWSAVDWVAIGT